MSYQQVKNTLFYVFLVFFIPFVFLMYYNIGMQGDFFIIDWGIKSIYSLQMGVETGRNVGEYFTIFPRMFGSRMLFFIEDPIARVKFATALTDTALQVSLWFVSAFFASRKHFKLALVVFAVLSIMPFADTYLVYTVANSIALLGLSLISWIPMFLYLRDNRLPQWMTGEPYKILGIWLVLIYCGTQVYDFTYMMIAPMSVLFGLYAFLQFRKSTAVNSVEDPIGFRLVNGINASYLLLSFFAFFRNYFLNVRSGALGGRGRIEAVSIDPIELFNRLKAYNGILIILSVLGLICAVYFLVVFVANKKIDGGEYLILSLCTGSLIGLGLGVILGSGNRYSEWLFFIAFTALLLDWWDTKKWVQVIMPTLILFLITELGVSLYHRYRKFEGIFGVRNDEKIIKLYKNAQEQGLSKIILSKSEAAYYGDEYSLIMIPNFMYQAGYTDKYIEIVVTNDSDEKP